MLISNSSGLGITYGSRNARLLDDTRDLALRVLAAPGKRHKRVRVPLVGEAALAHAVGVLAVEQGALEGDVGIAGAEQQLVGGAGDERAFVGRRHDDSLVDGGDVVGAVVQRRQDVGAVADLQIALFGERGGFDVLPGWEGRLALGRNIQGRRGLPFGLKATVGVCSRV